MLSPTHFADVAHVIQVAVAPVFLLSGIGVMLSLLTSRLGSIVERSRFLYERLEVKDEPRAAHFKRELDMLSRRSRWIDRAIALTTIAGLLICLVIAVLFVDYLMTFNLSLPVALLFLAAMLCFIAAFAAFLREVLVATKPLRDETAALEDAWTVAERSDGYHLTPDNFDANQPRE